MRAKNREIWVLRNQLVHLSKDREVVLNKEFVIDLLNEVLEARGKADADTNTID